MRKRLRNRLFLLAVGWTCCGMLIGGCWDYHDINHRAIPVLMGISEGEDKAYKVSLQIPIPTETKLTIKVVSEEANTVSEAIDNIKINIENYIDLLSVQMIVFDQAIAKRGLLVTLSNVILSRELAPKAILAITDDDMVKLLKNSKNAINNDVSTFYKFSNKRAGWTPKTAKTSILEAYTSSISYTEDIIVPIIGPGKETVLTFKGSAVLRQGKMVGRLGDEETLFMNLVTNRYYGAAVEVVDNASVTIQSAHVRWKETLEGKNARITGNINIHASLTEMSGPNTRAELVNKLEVLIKKRLERLTVKLMSSGSDPIGLGNHFRSKLAVNKLRNWRDVYYPNLQVSYNVKVRINNYGGLMQEE